MKIILLNFLIVFFVLAAFSNYSYGQVAVNDSSSLNHTIAYFNKSTAHESMLYNGPEYYFGSPRVKGNAFFQDTSIWRPGTVNYDGIIYKKVPMTYDLFYDEVVVQLYNGISNVTLLSDRVKYFNLGNHHFVRINSPAIGDKAGVKTGFYDQLYAGKTEVLVLREKSIQTTSGGISNIETYYQPKTTYYLKKGNGFYSFGSQGSMLSILKEKKKDIERYLKSNQLKYRSDPEGIMVKIASYYDQITN